MSEILVFYSKDTTEDGKSTICAKPERMQHQALSINYWQHSSAIATVREQSLIALINVLMATGARACGDRRAPTSKYEHSRNTTTRREERNSRQHLQPDINSARFLHTTKSFNNVKQCSIVHSKSQFYTEHVGISPEFASFGYYSKGKVAQILQVP